MNFKFWKKTMQTHNILETYDYPVFDNLKIVDTNINLMIPLLEKVLNKNKLIFETGRNYQLTGENNLNELLESFKLSTPTPEPEK